MGWPGGAQQLICWKKGRAMARTYRDMAIEEMLRTVEKSY